MKLKILSWNCQSLQTKVLELCHFLKSNFFLIVLLQETWLNSRVPIKVLNYDCVRQDRDSNSQYPHGGVAFLFHKSLGYKRCDVVGLEFIESIFINLSIHAFQFTVGSIYASSSLKKTEVKIDLEKLFARPGLFVFAGDYNAKHTSWNNVKSDNKGTSLLRICEKNLCEIHFSELPTAFPSVGVPSPLDFVVTKEVVRVSKSIVINDLLSDHIPISFEIPTTFMEMSPELKIKNFKKANWKEFRTIIVSELETFKKSASSSLHSIDDIDFHIETFTSIVAEATNKVISLKSSYVFRYPHSQLI
jgi:Endonuclease-reverse transcriptase